MAVEYSSTSIAPERVYFYARGLHIWIGVMLLEISIISALIGVVAAISGMILGWSARAKEIRKDAEKDAEIQAALRTDLEYLKRGIDDIRLEQKAQGQRIDAIAERLTRVEESAKQAHKRIDRIEQERGEW